ncbi:hypothetical protein Tco_1396235 [Tanacetum coccineum]
MMRATAQSTYILASRLETPPSGAPPLLPIPLPTPLPTLLLPSTDYRADRPEDARAVLSGRLNLLQRDKCSYAYTALLMEKEAKLSREAWGRSMDASNTARSEVRALRTTVLAQQKEIAAL